VVLSRLADNVVGWALWNGILAALQSDKQTSLKLVLSRLIDATAHGIIILVVLSK
jgi:hypothetical protein